MASTPSSRDATSRTEFRTGADRRQRRIAPPTSLIFPITSWVLHLGARGTRTPRPYGPLPLWFPDGNRTRNRMVFSHVLCQVSYWILHRTPLEAVADTRSGKYRVRLARRQQTSNEVFACFFRGTPSAQIRLPTTAAARGSRKKPRGPMPAGLKSHKLSKSALRRLRVARFRLNGKVRADGHSRRRRRNAHIGQTGSRPGLAHPA